MQVACTLGGEEGLLQSAGAWGGAATTGMGSERWLRAVDVIEVPPAPAPGTW